MIKRLIASIVMCSMIIALAMGTSPVAYAAEVSEETNVEVATDGTLLTHEEESSFTVYPRLRGVYLLKGTGTLTVPGNGLVGCYGTTTATMSVSKISISVRLERYVSGTWVGVSSWSNVGYNTNYISTYKGFSVTGGYYYRVVTEHWAATDWTMGSTSGIWVAK